MMPTCSLKVAFQLAAPMTIQGASITSTSTFAVCRFNTGHQAASQVRRLLVPHPLSSASSYLNRRYHPARPRAARSTRSGVKSLKAIENGVISGLQDALEILISTVAVIPLFRRLNLSPILGFLLSGIILGPHGLRVVKDVEDITELADFGVLFLLFEMGLELSIDRLKRLRKFAFGLGSLQVTITSAALGMGAYIMGASVPESVVIGSALSLSSSAFVIQLLNERRERSQPFATASFGVLLFQDIAVVPLLVLVPLLSSSGWAGVSQLEQLASTLGFTLIKALGAISGVWLIGSQFLKRLFNYVAESKSPEAFTSLVLLTVLGAAWFTDEFGLSMTLGAFLAGVLLAETNYRSQIIVDTEPFRGLLLGLFFITTGMSMDISLFFDQPLAVAFLISSLIAVKTSIMAVIGLPFGLSLAESIRIGLLLGQGGEFAFVLFALASKLGFMPEEVNNLLIVTVVASMALTPILADVGARLAPVIDRFTAMNGGESSTLKAADTLASQSSGSQNDSPVVLIGYGPVGKVIGEMLSQNFIPFSAIDLNPSIVSSSTLQGIRCVFGDATKPEFYEHIDVKSPQRFIITISEEEVVERIIDAVRSKFPEKPVFVRAKDLHQQQMLLERGVKAMYPEDFETSLQLGAEVLKDCGVNVVDIKSMLLEYRSKNAYRKEFSLGWNDEDPTSTGVISSDSEATEIQAEQPSIGNGSNGKGDDVTETGDGHMRNQPFSPRTMSKDRSDVTG